ncbi:hypothetical protein WAI453_008957 [Rhynchosporium graminicola]|uniref:Uncharacterized protein n=1 Tax=Rhynchosporium graminicola TaxID=2792576 RepID=A0A1E1L202_9HELO|nr:uncharacterized protein RCO7_07650 [Rhynchosporium commune]
MGLFKTGLILYGAHVAATRRYTEVQKTSFGFPSKHASTRASVSERNYGTSIATSSSAKYCSSVSGRVADLSATAMGGTEAMYLWCRSKSEQWGV